MTDEQEVALATSILAHELILQHMLANLISQLPPDQRDSFVYSLLNMPDLPMPEGIAMDLDSADKLAGVAQGVPSEIRRVVTASLPAARELIAAKS